MAFPLDMLSFFGRGAEPQQRQSGGLDGLLQTALPSLLAGLAGFGARRAPAETSAIIQGFLQGQELLRQRKMDEQKYGLEKRELDIREKGIEETAGLRRLQLESLEEDRRNREEDRVARRDAAARAATERTLTNLLKNEAAGKAIRANPRGFQVTLPGADGTATRTTFADAWKFIGGPVDEQGNPVLPEAEEKDHLKVVGGTLFDTKKGKVVYTAPDRDPQRPRFELKQDDFGDWFRVNLDTGEMIPVKPPTQGPSAGGRSTTMIKERMKAFGIPDPTDEEVAQVMADPRALMRLFGGSGARRP